MRLLHFADLHLGWENYNKEIDPQTGLSSCFGDFLAVLDEVVDFALNGDIDVVLFCGDAYKSRYPSPTHQREFAQRIARIASLIPVFLLVGNHDLPFAERLANTVEIFDTLAVKNVTVGNRLATHFIETRSGPLQIVALPWARRHILLKGEERNLTLEQLNQKVEEILSGYIAQQADKLDTSIPAIFCAHISLKDAMLGSEQMAIIEREPSLLSSVVANPRFRYVALGHIHKSQVLHRDHEPVLVYPGSLQRIDFSDEEEPKGFFVVEIGAKRGEVNIPDFHPVRARRFLTLKVKLSADDPHPTSTILRAIEQKEVREAIVRVQLGLSERSEGQVQETEIHKRLKEKGARFSMVNREVEHQHRPRWSGSSIEAMNPRQALEEYLKSMKVPPGRARTLLEYGERLIAESGSKQ